MLIRCCLKVFSSSRPINSNLLTYLNCVFLQCPRCACRLLVAPVTLPEGVARFSTRPEAPWRSSAKWYMPVPTTDPKFRGTEDDKLFRLESPKGNRTYTRIVRIYRDILIVFLKMYFKEIFYINDNYILLLKRILFLFKHNIMTTVMNHDKDLSKMLCQSVEPCGGFS